MKYFRVIEFSINKLMTEIASIKSKLKLSGKIKSNPHNIKINFFLFSSIVAFIVLKTNLPYKIMNLNQFSPEKELIHKLVSSGMYSEINARKYVTTLKNDQIIEMLKSLKNDLIIQAGGPVEFGPHRKGP